MKRELTVLDIVASDYVIQPVEFVKTKKHCYMIKEYANGGSLAQLLLMRSHIGIERGISHQGRLSEYEMKRVMQNILQAVSDLYDKGLGVWDLSPESLMLNIGAEQVDQSGMLDQSIVTSAIEEQIAAEKVAATL